MSFDEVMIIQHIRRSMLALVTVCFAVASFGQIVPDVETLPPSPVEDPPDEQPPTEMELESWVTVPMVRVLGTRVSLQLPSSFSQMKGLTTIQRDGNTGITVMDLSGGSYYTNAATFTPEGFEAKGKPVTYFEETTVAGYPAKYAQFRRADGHTTHTIVFGDSTFSAMLVGTHMSNETGISEKMKGAFLSVRYDKDLVIDPFEDAPFTLDDAGMKFQFATKGGPGFLYSLGGVQKKQYDDESFLVISPLPFVQQATEEGLVRENIDGMKKKGLVILKSDRGVNKPVNGYPSYAVTCKGMQQGVETTLLFQVVSHGDKALLILGRTSAKDAAHIKDFKKLLGTLRFR